jgi:hypothetical protein
VGQVTTCCATSYTLLSCSGVPCTAYLVTCSQRSAPCSWQVPQWAWLRSISNHSGVLDIVYEYGGLCIREFLAEYLSSNMSCRDVRMIPGGPIVLRYV